MVEPTPSEPTPDRQSHRFSFAECFAGIGGFRLGLEALGGHCVVASEYCRFAQATYRSNWPADSASVLLGDIRRLAPAQIPPHDLLVGGFPCQSFSNAGRRAGFDDDRGALFFEIIRLVTHCRPRAVLLENVRGLVTNPETLQRVLSQLATAGYPAEVRLYDAASLVPQRRVRAFIVGFRDGVGSDKFEWPVLPNLMRAASEVLEQGPQPQWQLSDNQWLKVSSSAYFSRHPGAKLLPVQHAVAQTLQSSYKRGYMVYSQFVPQPAPANPRFFTPRECARLMGFPETFLLPANEGLAFRQLGNAVCPPLIAALAATIVAALEADRSSAPTGAHPGGEPRRVEALPSRPPLTAEPLYASLRLVSAASPACRQPRACFLPPQLARLLEGCDAEEVPPQTFERTPGADYQRPPPTGWVSFPFGEVIRRIALPDPATWDRGSMAATSPSSDPLAPAQTLPAPLSAIKAEVARGMRDYLRVLSLTSGAHRADCCQ